MPAHARKKESDFASDPESIKVGIRLLEEELIKKLEDLEDVN